MASRAKRRETRGRRSVNTRGQPEGARFNTSSRVRAFALTSDRQIKLNDTRIVKGRRRGTTTTDIYAPRAADDVRFLLVSVTVDAAAAKC